MFRHFNGVVGYLIEKYYLLFTVFVIFIIIMFTLAILKKKWVFSKWASMDRKNARNLVIVTASISIYLFLRLMFLLGNPELYGYKIIFLINTVLSPEIIGLLAIVIYAFFTYMMFTEMRATREEEYRPYINLFFESVGSDIYFVIQNTGKSVACNIHFSVLKEVKDKKISILPFIKEMIPSLPPMQGMKTYFAFAFGNEKKIKELVYQIRVDYKSSTNKKYQSIFTLDLNKHSVSILGNYEKLLSDIGRELNMLNFHRKQ